MESFELIRQSRIVAQMAWDAVKVANPQEMGMYMRHPDVAEGDHEYAKSIIRDESDNRRLEFHGEVTTPGMRFAARDLVGFLQHRIGWGNEPYGNRGKDVEFGIASMIQYQNLIREHQAGFTGERAEAGMEKLLTGFAGSYAISNPQSAIEAAREKLDPLFEDGLRLSDHQRMSNSAAPDDPRLDQLAQKIMGATERHTDMEQARGRLQRQEAPAPVVRNGPRADDPWGMHP